MTDRISIAVDGPAASGKGTAARGVAQALDYAYIDTGAMYRAVGLAAQARGLPLSDEAAVGAVAQALEFGFSWDGGVLRLSVDGQDVTQAIRTEAAGRGASAVATLPAVRRALVAQQQKLADRGGVVMDGRDIGTVVLPDAHLKVFLDASVEVRAARRHAELQARGDTRALSEVLSDLKARDHQDRTRAADPLRPADDAVLLDSSRLEPAEVIDRILTLAAEAGARA